MRTLFVDWARWLSLVVCVKNRPTSRARLIPRMVGMLKSLFKPFLSGSEDIVVMSETMEQ